MGNPNFTVKWTLDEANSVRRAVLRAAADAVAEILAIAPAGTRDDDLPVAERETVEALRAEAGRLETILRRDF